jgi:hypothetical protein
LIVDRLIARAMSVLRPVRPSLPGVVPSFQSFSQASNEAAVSRIYAGQHFRYDQCAKDPRLGRTTRATSTSCARSIVIGITVAPGASPPDPTRTPPAGRPGEGDSVVGLTIRPTTRMFAA